MISHECPEPWVCFIFEKCQNQCIDKFLWKKYTEIWKQSKRKKLKLRGTFVVNTVSHGVWALVEMYFCRFAFPRFVARSEAKHFWWFSSGSKADIRNFNRALGRTVFVIGKPEMSWRFRCHDLVWLSGTFDVRLNYSSNFAIIREA